MASSSSSSSSDEEDDEWEARLRTNILETESKINRILGFIPPHLYVAPEESKHHWTKPSAEEKKQMKLEAKKGKRLRLDPTSGVNNVAGLQQLKNQPNIPKQAEPTEADPSTAEPTEVEPSTGGPKKKKLRKAESKKAKAAKAKSKKAEDTPKKEEAVPVKAASSSSEDSRGKGKKKSGKGGSGSSSGGKNVESLREKLHAKLDVLRNARKGPGLRGPLKRALGKAKQPREKREKPTKKRKLDSSESLSQNSERRHKEAKKVDGASPSSTSGGNVGIKFSTIEGIGNSYSGPLEVLKKKKKKPLQHLLQDAEKRQQRIADLKSAGKVSKESWNAAMDRSVGKKVYDDPKLIMKKMKRKEKDKTKSAKKWSERAESVKKMNDQVYEKKQENLKKVDMVRAAKREGKNLKLLDMKPSVQKAKEKEKAGAVEAKKSSRPGFEGSKKTFLNSPTK